MLARSAGDETAARADAEAAAAIYERLGASAARANVLAWLGEAARDPGEGR
jgi:hypothetical protein